MSLPVSSCGCCSCFHPDIGYKLSVVAGFACGFQPLCPIPVGYYGGGLYLTATLECMPSDTTGSCTRRLGDLDGGGNKVVAFPNISSDFCVPDYSGDIPTCDTGSAIFTTLSNGPNDWEAVRSDMITRLPDYPDDYSFQSVIFGQPPFALGFCGFGRDLGKATYALFHRPPMVSGGRCYRIKWVERSIQLRSYYTTDGVFRTVGQPLTAVNLGYSSDNQRSFTPSITIGAAPASGLTTQAYAIMASGGSVASIARPIPGNYIPGVSVSGGTGAVVTAQINALGQVIGYTVVNGGAGYMTPVVTVEAPMTGAGGASTATATAVTDAKGSITAVNPGAVGMYKPDAPLFSTPPTGGSLATASLTLNTDGSLSIALSSGGNYTPPLIIDSPVTYGPSGADPVQARASVSALNPNGTIKTVSLENGGTGYDRQPLVTAFGPDGVVDTTQVIADLGTTVPRSYTWNGVVPPHYDPNDQTTWSKTPDYEIDVPDVGTLVYIQDALWYCDGCT